MALKQMALNEIKELITKNEFPKAIAELGNYQMSRKKLVILNNFLGEWRRFREETLKGTISYDQQSIQENKIRSRLLGFVNDLESKESEKEVNFSKKYVLLFIVGLFLILILVVGYFQFFKERLEIFVDRHDTNFKTEIVRSTRTIGCWYDVTLVNNSNSPISIIHFQTKPINEPSIQGRSYGLFEEIQGSYVDYPIEIGVGKSKKYKLKVGLNLSEKAFKIVESKFKDLNNLRFDKVLYEVNSEQIDLFGNRILLSEYSGGDRGVGIDTKNAYQPLYFLSFKTAKGKEFKKQIGYYQLYLNGINKDKRFF